MLSNKVAIVTGGSKGIGKAIALEFAAKGANVAIIDVTNSAETKATLDEISALGTVGKAYACDVSSFVDTQNTVAQIIEDFGAVDVLVNNAGITRDGLMLSMSEDDFDKVIAVNLKGAFNLTKHLYGHFMKKRQGKIINIASVAGVVGNAGQANYASAKAGLIGLTKTIAKELAGRNITCNAIAPGFIKTDMTATLNEKIITKAVEGIPLKRMGEPEDIAKMVGFLAGDGGNYITGQVIQIDGGMCM